MRVATFLLLVAPFAGDHADAEMMRAQNGTVLPAPMISTIACADMKGLLAEYLESGYRGVDPVAPEHPDYPIFVYENRLATAFFDRCQAEWDRYEPPANAFGEGFD